LNKKHKILDLKMPEVCTNNTSPIKRQKMTDTLENILNKFQFVKILNENAENKLIIIHAVKKLAEETNATNEKESHLNAVIILEKPHFGLDEVKSFLEINNPHTIDIDNDVYKKLSIYPSKPFNS